MARECATGRGAEGASRLDVRRFLQRLSQPDERHDASCAQPTPISGVHPLAPRSFVLHVAYCHATSRRSSPSTCDTLPWSRRLSPKCEGNEVAAPCWVDKSVWRRCWFCLAIRFVSFASSCSAVLEVSTRSDGACHCQCSPSARAGQAHLVITSRARDPNRISPGVAAPPCTHHMNSLHGPRHLLVTASLPSRACFRIRRPPLVTSQRMQRFDVDGRVVGSGVGAWPGGWGAGHPTPRRVGEHDDHYRYAHRSPSNPHRVHFARTPDGVGSPDPTPSRGLGDGDDLAEDRTFQRGACTPFHADGVCPSLCCTRL